MILTHDLNDNAIGPIGRADAEILGSIATYYHEPRVLEIGSQFGHSAAVWLEAGCKFVVCVDANITPELQETARGAEGRCSLVECYQQDYKTVSIFDIIFLDASHDPSLNAKTICNLQGNLAQGGVLIVHDTGIWATEHMTDEHKAFPGYDLPEGKVHQPGEIVFVEWLKSNGWNCVSLGSKNALRHGLTICQR
jgi:predicted O-methyltransferase YrrM